ncbi:hypothetical protein TrispH2_005386 [Trichoplax sp. H2]|uniref:Uncharacterized protein n=1 Tax=Trichoplax adhaerens TaxID=10228 RepID=B3RVZ6_TRIAD|nr:predicted protein [Trichoplax adhaerens]EDV26086.1 predicted protein [Trichoplax adhaerens]RDD43087.1 hypothetical protein TrispH2_005386 [Trichoplax sp. H2]|eukprot:XP_002112119.1 predicted protein [Trichoplax adhaerens]
MAQSATVFSQPQPYEKATSERRVVYEGKLDENALASFMMKQACCCSCLPGFGCLFLQPCRAICWGRHEAHLQAQAVKVLIYEDAVEVRADPYMQCCTCCGAGAPPQPQNQIGCCWPSEKVIKAIPLDQISDVTISPTFECDRIRISSTVGGQNSSNYGIEIIGLQDIEAFKDAIFKQQSVRKAATGVMALPPSYT